MKSSTRSHRLSHSTTDPPDDWVDGSWTVDCICGVNFDDGEEMVDCDICGVWVHTRCSRYVKGETSFACHKCKAKNPRTNNKATITTSSNSNVDTEETEVAQLLIELPTKTIKTKTHDPAPCPLNNAPPPPRRPYGFWAERPYEERVHVQGVPGGDPSLFEGLPSSSIFTPQLWKCTGYIPKKLTVQYREFPEWGDPQQQEPDAAAAAANFEENCNNNLAENGGGGVLYPLSKDAAEETSPLTPGGLATGAQQENTLPSRKASRDTKSKSQHVNDNKESVNVVKKERSLLRPVALQYGTRKREDIGGSKERVGRKKPKEIVKEFVTKKDKSVGPKSAVSPSIRSSYFGNGQDNDRKLLKLGILDSKHGHGRDTGGEDASDFHLEVEVDHPTEKPKSTSLENISEALSSEVTGHDYSADKGDNLGKVDQPSSHPVKGSPKVDVVFPSMVDDVAGTYLAVDKGKTIDGMGIKGETYSEATAAGLQRSESLLKDAINASPEVKDNDFLEKPDADLLSSSHHGTKTEENAVNGGSRGPLKSDSAVNEVKMVDMDDLTQNTVSSPHISGDYKAKDAGATNSKINEHKTQEVDRCSEAVSDCTIAKANKSYYESLPARKTLDEQECHIDAPKTVFATGEDTPKFVSESNQSPTVVEDLSALDGPISCHPLSSSQTKSVAILKSSSKSSSIVVSRPPASDKSRTSNSGSNILVKEEVHSKANSNGKKDMSDSNPTWDEDRHEPMKLTPKEGPKSSEYPPSRALHQSRMDSLNASKASSLGEDDLAAYTSCKASSVQGNPHRSRSGELAGSSQNQGTKKGSTSALHPRGQRVVLSNSQSSSKATYSSSVQTPVSTNCPAGLSDEELALLLHQELNSSPRVPRVPRMRHGGFTQLSSAAASTLVKRTSGAGGKEQYPFSRRKSKDVRSSQEVDNNRQKKDKLPSSPDSARTGDAPNQVEANSESLTLVHKSVSHASAMATDRVPSSINANERKFPPKRSSPKANSDDDTASEGPVHQTLPALIAGILSKGRRMTYEELCNAVLPHWPTLRKHNGERYAYSSHSQAVLDCLRNRSEWARLVDRGPKTNPSRKRRKSDTGPSNTESEDNGSGQNASSKDTEWTNLEANTEDYPKGKRNLRKRRQLALQGRVVKYSRKRRKARVASDDGSGSFLDSTESESSEESQGHETHEASGSSDETAAML